MGFKIIQTGDWHIGSFKGPERDGVNLRSLDTQKCLEEMVHVAETEKPGGDLAGKEPQGSAPGTEYHIWIVKMLRKGGRDARHTKPRQCRSLRGAAGSF